MGSKKRQGKKNSGAGNPAKSAPRGRSVYRIQVEQYLESLRAPYTAWVTTAVPAFSPEDAATAASIQLNVVGAVGGEYAQRANSSNLHNIDVDLFGETLAEYLVSLDDAVAPEPIFSAWLDYLSFVEENKLWEGESEDFQALREMLEDTLDGFAESDAEICELLRATELFKQVKAFALALGDGVDMSDSSEESTAARTRVLRAVGVDPESFDNDEPAPLAFTYVWGAARLSVVTYDGPVMTLDEESYDLVVDGAEAGSAQLLFEMAVGAVQAHLNPAFDVTLRDEAHYLVLRNLLVTASTGRDGDLEGLRRNVGPKIYDAVLPEAQAAMESLANYGLLTKDEDNYSIDERLVPVISAGITEVETFFEEAE